MFRLLEGTLTDESMTFSIVAFDRNSGAAGAAAVTGGLAVGAFVPHVRAGVGAIATQGASTNWLYGERGLALLDAGRSAQQTLQVLRRDDEGRDYRQCVIVDGGGAAAGWTGSKCAPPHEHETDYAAAVAGNRLGRSGVAAAMLRGFAESAGDALADRLLAALAAGEAAGGDANGTISAALRVDVMDAPPVDIRVDYAPGEALAALADLYRRYRSAPFKDFCDTVPTRLDFSRFEA